MTYTCKRCWQNFPRVQRAGGACPRCGTAFENAELIALCVGLTCSFLLSLVLPEVISALLHGGAWQAPSNAVILLRAAVVTALLAGGLLFLSARYALWQGAALSAHPWLRLLWLLALPGLLYAGVVLVAGVVFVSLKQRLSLQRSFNVFLQDR